MQKNVLYKFSEEDFMNYDIPDLKKILGKAIYFKKS